MVDEGHITTFGVHPDWRRQGVGARLLLRLVDIALELGAARMTLEVRVGNHAAQELYRRFGFTIAGTRVRYYTDDGEDAFVMTTPALSDPAMQAHHRHRARAAGGTRRMSAPRILAIETSCDETGVAVVVGGRRIEANQVATQIALHAETGGIVPEVAARQQLRWMVPTLRAAMREAEVEWADLDAVAVTYGPGLIGSLLVGVNVARGIAAATGLPLIGVNHIEGHIYANWLTDVAAAEPLPAEPPFPLLCLVVSGGHTQLVLMEDHGRYRLLGQTADDAAGEAFDKVGRLLGLPYPGGPAISAAAEGAHAAVRFPRARTDGRYDFSFSGLKTAVLREVEGYRQRNEPIPVDGLAAAFEEAVVDALARKTVAAATDHGVAAVALGGGVAANRALRVDAARAAGGARPAAAGPAAGLVHGQRRHDRRRGRLPLRGRRSRQRGAGGDPEPVAALAGGVTDPLAPERLTPPTPGQLRRLLAAEKLQPRRSLSQNFLTDGAALDAIVDAAELAPGDRVVEVGPGLGVLTRRLLKAGASGGGGGARPAAGGVAAPRARRGGWLLAGRGRCAHLRRRIGLPGRAVQGGRQHPVPHHQPAAARLPGGGAAARAGGAAGAGRGGGADRRRRRAR